LDIQFSLFFYKHPLLFKTHDFNGIQIADIKDIATMKIVAIAGRGTKRDFVDLYFITKNNIFNLQAVFDLLDTKFRASKQAKIHVLKSLTFFEDADKENLPEMIKRANWDKVKVFFIQESKKISRNFLLN